MDRLYYHCTFCASTHSIHKKDVPLFTCTNNSDLDCYKCCKRLDTNCILKKICNQCIVQNCNCYIIQYLNGQQIPCDDDGNVTPNRGTIDLSLPGLCKITYKKT